ncbi:MAG: hypothetical protein HPY76_14445, partial [Anaerolineae bacterium]|nr:hypothetical protein [Anaerolineae bacterium]
MRRLVLLFLALMCLAGCTATPSPTASPTPEVAPATETPVAMPTATALPSKAVLVADPAADPSSAATL